MTTPTIARSGPVDHVAAADRTRLFDLASLLLSRPGPALVDAGYRIADSAADLVQDEVRQPVLDFLAWFAETDPAELERHYVAHYLCGRDPARILERELRERIPVLLEFAAVVGPGEGEEPLRGHWGDLESTRAALGQAGSPYAWLLEAVAVALSSSASDPR